MAMFLRLLLFMSATGTLMLLLYLVAARLLTGCISYRWRYRYLKVCMVLYLSPTPLLKELFPQISQFFRRGAEENLGLGNSIFLLADMPVYISLTGFEQVLTVVWIAGFCTVLLIYTVRYIRMRHKLYWQSQASVKYGDECITTLVEESRLRIVKWMQRRIKVAHVRSRQTPFTFGLFHPVIILTDSVEEDDGDGVVRHELTHIAGMDFLFRAVACVCVLIHFFNPFIYIFFRELKIVQELNCDERVIRHASGEERGNYARMLTRIYEKLSKEEENTAMVAFVKKKKSLLRRRVENLIHPIPQKNILCSVLLLLMVSVSALPVVAYEAPQIVDRREAGETSEMYEGVDWIALSEDEPACPEEDTYFKELDHFILLEDGSVLDIDSMDQSRASCVHNFVNGTEKRHRPKSDGGCEVRNYAVEVCTRCGYVRSSELVSYIVYVKCPHK